jgi:hypothetical protein
MPAFLGRGSGLFFQLAGAEFQGHCLTQCNASPELVESVLREQPGFARRGQRGLGTFELALPEQCLHLLGESAPRDRLGLRWRVSHCQRHLLQCVTNDRFSFVCCP